MVLMSFMKPNVCWEFHHMKLIYASNIATCLIDVWGHTICSSSILKLASTFVFWFFIHHEFFYTTKTKMIITLHMENTNLMIEWICVSLCMQYISVCTNVHMLNFKNFKLCVDDNVNMFVNLKCDCAKHNTSV